jgi:L-threonylcarbamoyladenylate synthase
LSGALETLRSGGVVAMPTETVSGLAVDAFDPGALVRLNRLKGKPTSSPVLLLVARLEMAQAVAGDLPASFAALARSFWPGPLTLVVPAGPGLPAEVSAGTGNVALRLPGLALPRQVSSALGRPISGVSANRHGAPPCRTALEVSVSFPSGVDIVLDGGPTPGGVPSTILDLTGDRPRILREGLIPASVLRSFVADLVPPDRPL